MAPRTARTEKLDLRISVAAKQKLRAAAGAAHRSVSDFVLHSALARADELLSEQRHFSLSAAQWKRFLKALDAPPPRTRA